MTTSKFATPAKTERMGFESDQKAVAENVILFILSMYCPRTYRVLLLLYVVFITHNSSITQEIIRSAIV